MTILCERCKREIARAGDISIPGIIEDVDIFSLPSVSVFDYAQLPTSGGIYFAIAAQGLCYIGKATNLFRRWIGHRQFSRFVRQKGARIAWLSVDDPAERDRLERDAIAWFNPLWNDGGAEFLTPRAYRQRFPKISGGKNSRSEQLLNLRSQVNDGASLG